MFRFAALIAAPAVLRPTTFTVDPKLSTGGIENFRELYVDGTRAGTFLAPKVPAPQGGAGDLVVPNHLNGWARVRVGELDVGVLGPLTDGLIHGVKAGTYAVKFTYSNGYAVSKDVATVPPAKP